MARKGRKWEDHLSQVLLLKPTEVAQEAVRMLKEHGCHVDEELKSELYILGHTYLQNANSLAGQLQNEECASRYKTGHGLLAGRNL